jgi:hypothetical protein
MKKLPPHFGRLIFGCIDADFASKYSLTHSLTHSFLLFFRIGSAVRSTGVMVASSNGEVLAERRADIRRGQ